MGSNTRYFLDHIEIPSYNMTYAVYFVLKKFKKQLALS